MQALILVTVIMVVSFGVFMMVFGNRYKPTTQVLIEDKTSGAVQLTPEAVASGVSESNFMEKIPDGIDSNKINSLFPEVKN